MPRRPDARERLLTAAESLFADQGLAGTSVRHLTKAAGVNLAAVNYYFGSKDGLFFEAVSRHLRPLNAERLHMLGKYERQLGRRRPAVEPILEAYFRPAFDLIHDPRRNGLATMRLIGKCVLGQTPGVEEFILREFQEIADRFGAMLLRAIKDLSQEQLFWRMHFTAGAFIHTVEHHHKIELLSHGICDHRDAERVLQSLVTFCATGFRAPVRTPARRKRKT